MATSEASRPTAISTRPMRGVIVARVESPPAILEIDLKPRAEIHRPGEAGQADVAEVAGGVARGNVHGAAEGDGQVLEVAAYADALRVDVEG